MGPSCTFTPHVSLHELTPTYHTTNEHLTNATSHLQPPSNIHNVPIQSSSPFLLGPSTTFSFAASTISPTFFFTFSFASSAPHSSTALLLSFFCLTCLLFHLLRSLLSHSSIRLLLSHASLLRWFPFYFFHHIRRYVIDVDTFSFACPALSEM